MLVKKIAEKEWKDNEFLLNIITNENVKSRIGSTLNWYIYNAVKAKFYYYLLSIITIVTPIATGVIVNFPESGTVFKITSSIFSGITAISAALLNLFDCRKNWSLYRGQAEQIKSILSKYLAKKTVNENQILKEIELSMSSTDENWKEGMDERES